MQRMGMVIGLKPEKIEDYKRLHADVWPSVLNQIAESNIRNFSIFLKEPENLLFGYWEYHGSDFKADAARMAADSETQKWWTLTDPCQEPLSARKDGEFWAMMEEVFHVD
ncbi:L-rhamnose mutarotase [uncultured Boseongicola sp.]|uniref:L-rhamnose mutarotase n=1 Tax=uncultured Boseongicola sp. TaxID=1648499 RepID=UPI002638C511|nr:L-rhamnose mutarotase [uncultured Boseongicola sp.]